MAVPAMEYTLFLIVRKETKIELSVEPYRGYTINPPLRIFGSEILTNFLRALNILIFSCQNFPELLILSFSGAPRRPIFLNKIHVFALNYPQKIPPAAGFYYFPNPNI